MDNETQLLRNIYKYNEFYPAMTKKATPKMYKEIAKTMGLTAATMTVLSHRLEDKGYIKMQNNDNKKNKIPLLTEKGKKEILDEVDICNDIIIKINNKKEALLEKMKREFREANKEIEKAFLGK